VDHHPNINLPVRKGPQKIPLPVLEDPLRPLYRFPDLDDIFHKPGSAKAKLKAAPSFMRRSALCPPEESKADREQGYDPYISIWCFINRVSPGNTKTPSWAVILKPQQSSGPKTRPYLSGSESCQG
jgi:hypothetical protein